MEAHSSLLAIILLLSILWLARKFKQKSTNHTQRLPPGPWKLPLIGNLHQLASVGSLPHHALRDLSLKYGPLMHLQLGEISAVVVSSPEMAKEMMKTHDHAFLQRPVLHSISVLTFGPADIAFSPYGEFWRQMRKICMLELLSSKRVQSFSFIREQEVGNLIESIKLSAGSPINLTKGVFSLVGTLVSRATFGKQSKDQEDFVSVVKQGVEMTGGFDFADLFPSLKPILLATGTKAKLEKMHKKQELIIENIIKDHQVKKMRLEKGMEEEEQENLVDVLLRVQQSGGLDVPITDNNIKAIIWDMFAAGTDTSATALEWAMSELMRNPRAMEKTQAEIRQAFRGKETIHESDVEELGYLKSVIKETLRLHPPLPLLLPRECMQTTNMNGYEIPMETKVIVNAWAIGRDPKHWHDAEKFIPERFHGSSIDLRGTNFEFIPFGAGRRICPGITFGLATIDFALAKLLYHFSWELPNGMKPDEMDMNETFGSVVGRKNNLYLIPTPYDPSIHDNDN